MKRTTDNRRRTRCISSTSIQEYRAIRQNQNSVLDCHVITGRRDEALRAACQDSGARWRRLARQAPGAPAGVHASRCALGSPRERRSRSDLPTPDSGLRTPVSSPAARLRPWKKSRGNLSQGSCTWTQNPSVRTFVMTCSG